MLHTVCTIVLVPVSCSGNLILIACRTEILNGKRIDSIPLIGHGLWFPCRIPAISIYRTWKGNLTSVECCLLEDCIILSAHLHGFGSCKALALAAIQFIIIYHLCLCISKIKLVGYKGAVGFLGQGNFLKLFCLLGLLIVNAINQACRICSLFRYKYKLAGVIAAFCNSGLWSFGFHVQKLA